MHFFWRLQCLQTQAQRYSRVCGHFPKGLSTTQEGALHGAAAVPTTHINWAIIFCYCARWNSEQERIGDLHGCKIFLPKSDFFQNLCSGLPSLLFTLLLCAALGGKKCHENTVPNFLKFTVIAIVCLEQKNPFQSQVEPGEHCLHVHSFGVISWHRVRV